jgi:ParB-like chromosome segregation protein Spo0J
MTTKTGIQGIAAGRSDTFRISLDDLHIRQGWNARDVDFNPNDEDDLALAQSIAEVGVKETMTAIWEDGRAYITNGHRRRAAALYARDVLKAEIKTVPVQTEARYASEADHVLSQIVRNSSKPLSPFEKGKVFKKLLDLGWNEGEIAKKTGITRTRVVQLLEVQSAPEQVKAMVRSGEVSADLAMKTVRAAEGDTGKAVSDLAGAIETAKKAGKTRATAKHVEGGEPRSSLKKAVGEMLRVSEVDIDETEGTVTLTLPKSYFDRLKEAAGY